MSSLSCDIQYMAYFNDKYAKTILSQKTRQILEFKYQRNAIWKIKDKIKNTFAYILNEPELPAEICVDWPVLAV